MARRQSIAVQERELEYAKAREAYQRRTDVPQAAYSGKRPLELYAYRPVFLRTGLNLTVAPLLKIKASELAVTKIGVTDLNINKSDTNIRAAIEPPQSFQPSIIRASSNRGGDPVPVTAYGGTGRKYRKYTIDSTKLIKGTASAPVCVDITQTSPTLNQLVAVINNILAKKNTIVGVNSGSLSYALESLREVEF